MNPAQIKRKRIRLEAHRRFLQGRMRAIQQLLDDVDRQIIEVDDQAQRATARAFNHAHDRIPAGSYPGASDD